MAMPVDYGMCTQTVTVYRKTPEGIVRIQISGCFLQWQDEIGFEQTGVRKERKFLLIQPGTEQMVFPGDRVLEGIGPEISVADWETFLPVRVNGLGEVAYATAYHWEGDFCHTEAGRK